MRNLAVVEEFDIRPHAHQNGSTTPNSNGNANARWDPTWNGRKNFKKFRRQGDPDAANIRRGTQNLIVPLEEVKKKTLGLGDDYWLESGSSKTKRKRGRESQSQAGEESLLDAAESAATPVVARNGVGLKGKGKGKVQATPRELKREDVKDESMDDLIDVEAPRKTRTTGAANASQARRSAGRVSMAATGSAMKAGSKRTAAFAQADEDEESDSEDELKFRFGKRRKVGK